MWPPKRLALLATAGACTLGYGCEGSTADTYPARSRARIIGGTPAPSRTGVVRVVHRESGQVCSGGSLAPRLAVTALHCVLREGAEAEPLAADGFRVGFGPGVEALEEVEVTAVHWIGGPAPVSVDAAAQRGEDIAVLVLASAAPMHVEPLAVRFEYAPRATDTMVLAGFGLSSVETGQNGTLLEGWAAPTGFDPDSGILQIEGDSACFGDSGGPVLLEPAGELVGVIGAIGGTSDASFCDIGLTLAATTANPRVRAFLGEHCSAVGGCATLPGEAEAGVSDAAVPAPGGPSDAPAGPTPVDASTGTEAASGQTPAGCDCSAARGRGSRCPPWMAVILAIGARWRRSR
jgi:hypothetical protein